MLLAASTQEQHSVLNSMQVLEGRQSLYLKRRKGKKIQRRKGRKRGKEKRISWMQEASQAMSWLTTLRLSAPNGKLVDRATSQTGFAKGGGGAAAR